MAGIYLDHHATTPCDPRVVDAMLPTFTGIFGNAASRQHAFGAQASSLVEAAREKVASLVGASCAEIVFTSGATESNNLAIKGVATYDDTERGGASRRHIITTSIEHKAVLDPCGTLERRGFRVTYLPVTSDGIVRVEDVEAALDSDTALVSVMLANNEIGTLQPVAEIGALCKERGVIFHCDAAQALALIRCDVDELGVDLLSMSAHKMYGPKGVGALYARRKRPRVRLVAQIDGGGHERGARSGTLNVPGIVGLGAACELAARHRVEDAERVRQLRDKLQERLLEEIPGARVNGSLDRRLPNNLNLSVDGVRSDQVLDELDGVAVSSGSACSSASVDDSYVLGALGDGRQGGASLRFGLGRSTTASDIEAAVPRVVDAIARARQKTSDAPSDCDTTCG